MQNRKEDNENNLTPNVMEFPPLTICRQTGGNWTAVNSTEFPLKAEEGVYNPTTNPEINFKCFCPNGKNWDVEEGCKWEIKFLWFYYS